jgi:hypothetical protein
LPGLILLLATACSNASNASAAGSLVPVSPAADLTKPAAAVAAVAMAASPQGSQSVLASALSPNSLVPPPGQIYFGAQVNPDRASGSLETVTEEFEKQIDRTLALHAEYYYWRQPFPGVNEQDDYAHGRVPVISWDCGAKAIDVINGREDAIIRSHAILFRQYGHSIFLRYFWEMNLPFADENRENCIDPIRDVNGYISPSDFISAWDHIRAIFRAEGATNVIWLWCPSGYLQQDPMQYYPGPAQTAWVGFDHYDKTGSNGLLNTLAAPYAELETLQKPMMVAETGTIPGHQYPYLSTAPQVLQQNFPHIRGFLYFDEPAHRENWVLDAAGIAGAKVAGAAPYFAAMAHL